MSRAGDRRRRRSGEPWATRAERTGQARRRSGGPASPRAGRTGDVPRAERSDEAHRPSAQPWPAQAERTGRAGRAERSGRGHWPAQAERTAAARPSRSTGPPAPRTPGDPPLRRGRRPAPSAPAARYRRRRRIAAVLLGLVFVTVAGSIGGRALLYDAGLADVEGLEITGLHTVPETAVREAAAVTTGHPLAGVDLGAIERRVEQIPAVADAEAGRSWPHTVTLTVTERVPIAVADTARGPHLVDAVGVAFLPAPDPAAFPRLATGPVEPGAPPTPATRTALAVLESLPGPVREAVRGVEVGPPPAETVTLTLTEDRQVRWGSPDRAEEKAAVLEPLLTQPGSVYDVASPELPTIRR